MKEYKILRDTDSELQKKLNQWRHEFHIEIISVFMDNRMMDDDVPRPWGNLVIVLARERKEARLWNTDKSFESLFKQYKEKRNL